MFKYVILLFVVLNLFGKDYVNIYRFQGINEVEKEIEKSLTDINYWREYLVGKNIDYGYYEYKKYVFIVDKICLSTWV